MSGNDPQIVVVKSSGCFGCIALLLVIILVVLLFPFWFPVLLGLVALLGSWTR